MGQHDKPHPVRHFMTQGMTDSNEASQAKEAAYHRNVSRQQANRVRAGIGG